MPRGRKSITFIDNLISIKKEIKLAFLMSLASILFIEIILKNYPASSNAIYVVGDIYLKVCYSIVATAIFFLINQHIPKENRNVKTNRYIGNKLTTVSNELSRLLETLGIDQKNLDITEQIIKEACEKINPESQVIELRINIFPNWRDYLKYKTDKINQLLTDVMILNSSIETELLEHIVNMLDALDGFYYLNNRNISLGKDLSFYSYNMSYLFEENYKIYKIFNAGKYKIYTNTNMNDYKKTN
jgi:hypothetical protein